MVEDVLVTLSTPRLFIRPCQPDDLHHFAEIFPHPDSELNIALESWTHNGFGTWLGFSHNDSAFICLVEILPAGEGLQGIAPSEIELGWATAERYRGLGFATEATIATVKHTFATSLISALAAYVRVGNAPSLRIAAKLGMRYCGDGRARNGDAVRIYRLQGVRF